MSCRILRVWQLASQRQFFWENIGWSIAISFLEFGLGYSWLCRVSLPCLHYMMDLPRGGFWESLLSVVALVPVMFCFRHVIDLPLRKKNTKLAKRS